MNEPSFFFQKSVDKLSVKTTFKEEPRNVHIFPEE